MNKKEKVEESTSSQREKKVRRSKADHLRSVAVGSSSISVDSFLLEEKQSNETTTEDIHKSFKESCTELRKIFQGVLKIKRDNMTKNESSRSAVNMSELENMQEAFCLQIMKMKQLNRLDKHRAKKSRDMVSEKKQKMDSVNLQYQNLQYEKTYVQREVTKCVEFRSQDEDIDLVPVAEFYKEAPKEISKPEVTKHDNHELTLARLRWELEQRKTLAMQLKESELKKEVCINSIKKLKERLDSIYPTLCGITEAAEPLHDILGMPLQVTHPIHQTAKFLPQPLHVLYVELCAYSYACDKKMSVIVDGCVDDAKIFQLKIEDSVEDSGESDQEENTNTTYHKRSVSGRQASMNDDILSKHPLSVDVIIVDKGVKILLKFHYLIHLNVVTVNVKAPFTERDSSSAGDSKFDMSSFLDYLFPGDDGTQSPNPVNKFHLMLSKYGETSYFSEETGFPYVWAQKLAGLHFISDNEASSSSSRSVSFIEVSPGFVEETILAIKSRLRARMSLSVQLTSLEHGSKFPIEVSSMYHMNIVSQLKKWTVVSWEHVVSLNHPCHQELLDLDIISQNAEFYEAVIERGSAVLTALIFIFPDYPVRSPTFLLFLHYKAQSTAVSNFSLREMEGEVNVHCIESLPAKQKNNSLSCQMCHLFACFDVFLETECCGESLEGPREFVREKIIARNYRGRDHSRPYMYISSKGIFTAR